ncbi:MAG: hypothetical protein M3063_05515 [Actinomycetota bacterium]|nr:hypothetical protein [Actinomycetota bacterium]
MRTLQAAVGQDNFHFLVEADAFVLAYRHIRRWRMPLPKCFKNSSLSLERAGLRQR